MSDAQKHFSRIQKQINDVSPSFCAAKWSQVTLHLHNGRTHSCHHPSTHLVPLAELENNPSALHNTCFKKMQRKDMLDGKRPSECQYCWNVEDLPGYKNGEFFSDRVVKSASNWSQDRIEAIRKAGWQGNINPSYVEVSFSNICNFKCSYCGPVYSSRWVEEAESQGPYPTSGRYNNLEWYRKNKEMPIHHREHNPYVEAFWKWWPELVGDLRVFRITGGEPLLAADTYKVLDFLSENPQPELEFAVNTNLCVPGQKITTFKSRIRELLTGGSIKSFNLFTSVDGHGRAAEYGRFGLDYRAWLSNLDDFLLEVPESKVTIMSTVNVFSTTTYLYLLEDLLRLKAKHGSTRLSLDIAILRYPQHQCLSILTNDLRNCFDECLSFMKSNSNVQEPGHFMSYEILRMNRLIGFVQSQPSARDASQIHQSRKDFVAFVDEHDRRRGTNFRETFPDLAAFYEKCRSLD